MLRLLGSLARIFLRVVLAIWADAHQIGARWLRQSEAIRSNRLVHSNLLDCYLQLIVFAWPRNCYLPRIRGAARGLPICVGHVRNHLTTRAKILNSRDAQVRAIEPYFLRDFPVGC